MVTQVPIGKIAKFINGRAFKPSEWGTTGLPIIRIQNLTGSSNVVNYFAGEVDKKHLIFKGDILISWSASLGVYIWNGEDAILNQHIFKVITSSEVDELYFYYAIMNVLDEMVAQVHGSTMQHITKDPFEAVCIPLPPLDEQKRIAAILEEADHARRTRRFTQSLSDTFLQEVFVEMFGDVLDNPSHSTELSKLVKITGGGTPSRSVPEYFQGTIPWVTAKDMKSKYIHDAEEHVTSEAITNSAARLIPPGSLLIVVKSKVLMHTLPVAMTAVEVCHNQDIKAIEPCERIDAYFLWHLLKYNQPKLLEQARGANTEGLTLDMLHCILVPNVALSQQREFAEIVLNHQKSQAQQHESARQAEHLFQTLLYRAFRGEL